MGEGQAGIAEDLQAAMAALMRCMPGVRAVLLRMTRDLEVTKDLAQEVTVAAWQAIQLGRLRDLAALPAYVLQCAKNQAFAYARKPRPASVESLPDAETAWGECPPTPLECCESSELRSLASQVLAELPTDRDRALIRGFYVDGRSKTELMATHGLGKDLFDRVISRARGRMRELLHNKLEANASQVRGSSIRSIPVRNDPGAGQ